MANEREHTMKIEEEVGRFGFQSAFSIAAYLKTKIGISIIAEIIQDIFMKERQTEFMLQDLNAKANEQNLQILEEQKELDEKNDIAWRNVDPLIPLAPPITNLQDQKTPVISEAESVDDLKTSIDDTEETYSSYNQSVEKSEQFVKDLKIGNVQDLTTDKRAEILSQLGKEIETINNKMAEGELSADEMVKCYEDGDMLKVKKSLEAINSKSLRIAVLKDLESVVTGNKVMYNKNGEQVDSFDKADFILPKDKKLIKDGEEFYLLKKEDELSDENKTSARSAFKRAEHELSSVKDFLIFNKNSEINYFTDKITQLQNSPAHKHFGTGMTPIPDTPSPRASASNINDLRQGLDNKREPTELNIPPSAPSTEKNQPK